MELKVNINDKVSKITKIYEAMSSSGFLTHNGKLIANPDDVTFAKIFTLNKSKFAVSCGNIMKDPVKWVRFSKLNLTDYFYLEVSNYDAVIFVPKCKIYFHGFGIMGNYNKKDVTYKVQWIIEEDASAEYEILKPYADIDTEKLWHEIILTELGEKPILIKEN